MGKDLRTDSVEDFPITMVTMSAPQRNKDRHRNKPLVVRLHPLLRKQLEQLARTNLTNMSAEVAAAIRKHLAENKLWPPAADAK